MYHGEDTADILWGRYKTPSTSSVNGALPELRNVMGTLEKTGISCTPNSTPPCGLPTSTSMRYTSVWVSSVKTNMPPCSSVPWRAYHAIKLVSLTGDGSGYYYIVVPPP